MTTALLAIALFALGTLIGALLAVRLRTARRGPPVPEGLVRQALDRMQFGVTISDSSGGIAYANPALEGMHGYGAGELVGQPSHVLGAPSARRTLAASDLSDRQMWRRETLNKRKNGETFPVHLTSNVLYDDAGAMQGLITICENISDQKQQQEQEEREALRDSLTGLASRGFFLQLVQRVVERRKRHTNRQFAVLYVDLDRFNLINESLGHEVGDRLLVGVADRLVACVRPSDVVARIAGDEFALLLDDLEGERGSAQVAQRILKEFEAAFEVAGRSLYVNPSIGIVLSDARYSSAEQYVADAAAAMNRARAQREGNYAIFDQAVHQRATQRLRLETDLRLAVDRSEFRVLYQPIVDLPTEAICGFEALVRWNHSERGIVGPNEFIPVAEETGLIVPIGREVMRMACATMVAWRERYAGIPDLCVNVNMSARHLRREDVVDEVLDALKQSGLPPSALKVEITETLLMEDADTQVGVVRALRDAGIGVAIDDFGTGYSSLSYLRRFQVDTLKIDRAFVSGADVEDAWAIVDMIIALARGMEVIVVAEGVETEQQKERLRALGCDRAQGFLFGRPVEAAVAGTLLEKQARAGDLDSRPTGPRFFDGGLGSP